VSDHLDATDRAETVVYAGNIPPQVTILSPLPWQKYPADGTVEDIEYWAIISDPDGTMAPTFYWQFALGHDNHRHELEQSTELRGTFPVFAVEDPSAWYIFDLHVTDERGQKVLVSVNVHPEGEGPAMPAASASEAWMMLE